MEQENIENVEESDSNQKNKSYYHRESQSRYTKNRKFSIFVLKIKNVSCSQKIWQICQNLNDESKTRKPFKQKIIFSNLSNPSNNKYQFDIFHCIQHNQQSTVTKILRLFDNKEQSWIEKYWCVEKRVGQIKYRLFPHLPDDLGIFNQNGITKTLFADTEDDNFFSIKMGDEFYFTDHNKMSLFSKKLDSFKEKLMMDERLFPLKKIFLADAQNMKENANQIQSQEQSQELSSFVNQDELLAQQNLESELKKAKKQIMDLEFNNLKMYQIQLGLRQQLAEKKFFNRQTDQTSKKRKYD